jgi:hypothetical protein
MYSLESEEGDCSVTAKFSSKNQDGKREERCLQAAGKEAERISDNGQPGEEEGPDAVPSIYLLRFAGIPIGKAQDLADKKVRAEDTDEVGGAGPEIITKGGDGDDLWGLLPTEDQQYQKPFRADREDRRGQKTGEEEGRETVWGGE